LAEKSLTRDYKEDTKFLYGINYREEAIKQNSFISFVMGWGDIEGEELHTAQGQQHGL